MDPQLSKRLVFDEFELDTGKLSLIRDGVPVHIPRKPFRVLLYLIENRERVVSRSELLDAFWEGHDVYEDTLTKCVGNIRKALDDRSEIPKFIQTQWAEGYRFVHTVNEIPSDVILESTRGLRIRLEEEYVAPTDDPVIVRSGAGSWRSTALTISAVAIVAAMVTAMWYLAVGRSSGETITRVRSVAVLPLRNLTGDPANDYLCEGISESLISTLSQNRGLKVIAQGSSFKYRDDPDPVDAGRSLNVESVLVGAIRKSGGRLRISARLLSTTDRTVLWAGETADRPAEDIFALQDEISRNASMGLRGRSSAEIAVNRRTRNMDAYQSYLKGRYLWKLRTVASLLESVSYYKKAAELDPAFSLAYAGMADSYQLLAEYRGMKTSDAFDAARKAALKAIELDDTAAEGHNALAYTLAFYDWKWNDAEHEFAKAIELNPNYAIAHQWYSELLTTLGRFDEAEREALFAFELDPLSVSAESDVVAVYYMTRRQDQAIAQANKTLAKDPNFSWGHIFLWVAYEQKGMEAESVAEWAKAVRIGWGDEQADALLSAYKSGGKTAFWRKYLEQSNDPSSSNIRLAWDRVICYLRLDDRDQVFAWLEKSYDERDRWIMNIRYDPQFDSIRNDSRYVDLVRRVGLEP